MKHEIEIELPESISAEWEPVRFGVPNSTDHFISDRGEVINSADVRWDGPRLILKPKRWVPKIGEDYFTVEQSTNILETVRAYCCADDEWRIRIGNCYRTKELAQAAAERVRKAYQE